MKNILVAVSLFLGINQTYSQTKSYNFAQPLSPAGIEVQSVSKSYFGTYTLDDKTFIFSKDGIWSKTTIYLSISKKTVRENSKYSVRNNYLFGVKKDDSIPCFLNKDTYYYGLREEIELVGENSLNKLIDDGTSYYINFYEDGSWIPAKISFKQNKLHFAYFDYPDSTTVFDAIKLKSEKKEDGLHKITLWPTEQEWSLADKAIIFPEEEKFIKKEEEE